MSYTERLWELGLLTLDFGRLRGAPINVQVPKGYLKKTERGTTSSEQGGKRQWTQTEIQEILKAVEKLFFSVFLNGYKLPKEVVESPPPAIHQVLPENPA